MDKIKSYAVTFRPLGGVTDSQLEKFSKWVRKQCVYYHVVTEMTMASRHVHAGLILKTTKSRSNLCTDLIRLYPDLTSTEKSVFRTGIKIMYNEDWIRKYLAKDVDGETVELMSNVPEVGHMESYFPPKPPPKGVRRCSIYYHELEAFWYQYEVPEREINTRNARSFLARMMYKERCIPVMRDDKTIIQTAKHLCRWLVQCDSDIWEGTNVMNFEQEETYST